MTVTTRIYIGIGIIFLAFAICIYRFKMLDKASKVILVILALEIVNEIIAFIFAKKFHNNMPIYNINDIVELFLIALYFNYAIRSFRKKNIGIWIGVLSVIFGIINFSFFQSLDEFSINFLLFEGFCVIIMSLLAFYRFLMVHEDLQLYRSPHFWFASIFLFFWSITYLNWGLFPIIVNKISGIYIWMVNIISYGAIGLVFLFYPKMNTANE